MNSKKTNSPTSSSSLDSGFDFSSGGGKDRSGSAADVTSVDDGNGKCDRGWRRRRSSTLMDGASSVGSLKEEEEESCDKSKDTKPSEDDTVGDLSEAASAIQL